MDPDRSQFYTGFVAECYDLLIPDDEAGSYRFFQQAIEAKGEPALELGCGTGRPLLGYLEAGLDVEGLDSSADMLEPVSMSRGSTPRPTCSRSAAGRLENAACK
jgi:ubiquinone/menaquinone biosynthesis C-methylase UbiE